MSTRHRPDLARSCGSRRRPAAQAGFTLVELMVSLAISLVILAALVALFVNTNRSSREFERANSMIENGRLAVQVLENDVIHAGFWGTHVPEFDDQTLPPWITPADVPTVLPDPCLAYANWNDDVDGDGDPDQRKSLIGVPVQAYEDAVVCGGVIQNKVANTDILVVRHAEMCVPGVSANCEADVAGRLYFQDGRCTTDLVPYVLDTAGFTLLQRDCAAVADKRKFISNIYYVRDFAVTPGDGTPTLVRSQFDLSPAGDLEHLPAVPLIEGIERFRVELGIDDVSETGGAVDYSAAIDWVDPENRTSATNRGDGVPDGNFLRCTTLAPCTLGDLMNVTAVKLYVLARSPQESPGYTDTKTYALGGAGNAGPFDDGFKRHLFVTTVRLPNFAGRRITP